jgi:beta-glucosidase-like glycosyl hydrolase
MASHIVTGLAGEPRSGFRQAMSKTPFTGYLIFHRDFAPPIALADPPLDWLRELSPDAFIAMDEEGGLVTQLHSMFETIPSARVLGRGASVGEVRAIATRLARDLRTIGVTLDFAPVCDVDLEPTNPVIGPRSFSNNPEVVAEMAAAFAAGLQDGGVLACAKHFPGHGGTRLDSHLDLPVCRATREELAALHLPPFRKVIADGIPMIMVSHVAYPGISPEGLPATLSREIVTGLLREELGYEGVIITDAMEMKAVASSYPPGEAAVRAMEAGVDLLCYGCYDDGVAEAIAALDEARRTGRLAAERLDASRDRISSLQQRMGRTRAETPVAPPEVDRQAICRRALRWVGPERQPLETVGRNSRWMVVEPDWDGGKSLSDLVETLGVTVGRARWWDLGEADLLDADAVLVASCQRQPPSHREIVDLAAIAAERPTWLVAFAQDAFLQEVSGAAGRLSAGDPGPVMRRVVAETLFGRA